MGWHSGGNTLLFLLLSPSNVHTPVHVIFHPPLHSTNINIISSTHIIQLLRICTSMIVHTTRTYRLECCTHFIDYLAILLLLAGGSVRFHYPTLIAFTLE
ncbi:unnamed protein product [Pylaiella littoralis]